MVAVNLGVVQWFQFAYAIWQFVRVAKFCRLPYATLAHTFMWLIGRWGRPFTVRNYLILEPPREKFYITADLVGLIQPWKDKKPGRDCILDLDVATEDDVEAGAAPVPVRRPLRRVTVKDEVAGITYQLCSRTLTASFLWNYLRDDPYCFVRSADLIFPTFDILDRVCPLDGLKKICQGDYVPVHKKRRFLAVPDREWELNQNFMRMLATIPLMAQAKGFQNLSLWISLVIVGVDQFSLLFNWLWQCFKDYLFFTFHIFMIKSQFQPQTRKTICVFFSTISDRMMFSDDVRLNFIRLRKGDLVYTMSPFNGTGFEIVKSPPFERKRKEAVPYTEERFGVYEEVNGDKCKGFPEEGTPIISHVVQGSRIDTIFLDNGGFYNFINNQHLHFGRWKGNDKEDFEDLLQLMEQMQMLPLLQTDAKLFKSLKFNVFLTPGRCRQDITFLTMKKNGMIGGII